VSGADLGLIGVVALPLLVVSVFVGYWVSVLEPEPSESSDSNQT
jgi:hypothetical protein